MADFGVSWERLERARAAVGGDPVAIARQREWVEAWFTEQELVDLQESVNRAAKDLATGIGWDIDANLPLYTRDYLKTVAKADERMVEEAEHPEGDAGVTWGTPEIPIRPPWDDYFAAIAVAVAGRADCRRRQVGAVIVDADHGIVSTGYNGAPSGVPGCLDGHCPRGLMSQDEIPAFSAYDNCISIHAEANALLYARQSLVGATIYITCPPCRDCRKLIIGSGITRMVYPS